MKSGNSRLLLVLGAVLFGVTAIWWGVGTAGGDMKYEADLNKRLQQNDTSKATPQDNIREVTPQGGSQVIPSDQAPNTYSSRSDNLSTRKNFNTGDAADYKRDANNPAYRFSGKSRFDKNDVMTATSSWSSASKKAVNNMLHKYGNPDLVTEDMIVWKNTGPFLSSTVLREGVKNNFPNEHTGVLEQVIAYKVPVDKVDDLYRFNGGIIVDRAQGTLTVRGSTEEMNLAALNVVHDIIANNSTSADAQQEFSRISTDASNGTWHTYTKGLDFNTYAVEDTRDPGRKPEPQRASR